MILHLLLDLPLVPSLVVGIVALGVLSALLRAWQCRQLAKSWGCQPIPHLPRTSPLDYIGLPTIMRSHEAAVRGRLPWYFSNGNKRMSELLGRPVNTYAFNVLHQTWIMSHDTRNIKAMLATQFDDFGLGTRPSFLVPLLGPGIFTSEGAVWSHSRQLLKPAFSREHIYRLPGLDSALTQFIQVVQSSLPLSEEIFPPLRPRHATIEDGHVWTRPVDLVPLFFALTIDNSTRLLFGQSTDSLGAMLSPHSTATPDFAVAFDEAQEWTIKRTLWGPLHSFYNPREFREKCKACHDFVDEQVARVLDRRATNKLDDGDYLLLAEVARETRNPLTLRYQMLNVLLAGRDTTAGTLSWAFWLLARDPRVWDKLRGIVLDKFGPAGQEEITFEKLKSCQYLQHVINEVLRLFPIVPANTREAVRDTTLPVGGGPAGEDKLFVPKGTVVGYSVFVTQRDESIWGPDANDFRPERWTNRRVGWEYLPFNGGARICIGQQFALTTIGYTLVRMLQAFDKIELVVDEPDARAHIAITMKPMHGTRVQLRQA